MVYLVIPPGTSKGCVTPHDPESMQAWPVSREVNQVGLRDDAGFVEPLKGEN